MYLLWHSFKNWLDVDWIPESKMVDPDGKRKKHLKDSSTANTGVPVKCMWCGRVGLVARLALGTWLHSS